MLRILNDVHIGVNRIAGTTPESAHKLREHILSEFKRLLPDSGDVMILGDLFDSSNIPLTDVLKTYQIIVEWSGTHDGDIYNARGNHDVAKTSNVMSSFDFLGSLLKLTLGDRYIHIDKPKAIRYGWVIPHLPNQDLFNLALEDFKTFDGLNLGRLFLHCNYDNNFAAQSDQSLNLSREQAEGLNVGSIVIGHEHHPRTELAGKVILPGNQVASSVSDWLQEGSKQFCQIGDDGTIELVACSNKQDEFIELPWNKLQLTDHKFIRVTGRVAAAEHSKLITVLNAFRRKSDALVITNAVEVISENNQAIVAQSLESAQQFSVWSALEEILTKDEMKLLASLGD